MLELIGHLDVCGHSGIGIGIARLSVTLRELEQRSRRVANRTLYCLLIAFASPRAGELEQLCAHHIDTVRGVLRHSVHKELVVTCRLG